MNSGTLETSPISSSISRHASLAPPCAGPQSEAMPAAMHAYGLAPEEPHRRTVDVEAFCSWSACRMKMRSMARTRTSFTWYSSAGTPNIMRMKFAVYERLFFGYMNGWPIEYLYDIATMVGIFAISRNAEITRCCGLLM